MQVANRPYRPPKLGFMPPPPLCLGRLSVPLPASSSNVLQGLSIEGPTNAILLAVGGVGLSYFARFMPGVGEPIAMVGGLGLLGLGVYKFYNVTTGAKVPVVRKSPLPPDQVADDVYQLLGKIKTPANGTKVELTNRWALLFGSQKTIAISFAVTNIGRKPVAVEAEFITEQFTRPVFGNPETAKFMTPFIIENIDPGRTVNVDGWHPVDFMNSLFTSLDIVGTLNLRTFPRDPGKVFSTVDFIAG
jgi:hypothetical protein